LINFEKSTIIQASVWKYNYYLNRSYFMGRISKYPIEVSHKGYLSKISAQGEKVDRPGAIQTTTSSISMIITTAHPL
jgi:hypothetical protein